jgi:hypothetical protein
MKNSSPWGRSQIQIGRLNKTLEKSIPGGNEPLNRRMSADNIFVRSTAGKRGPLTNYLEFVSPKTKPTFKSFNGQEFQLTA